MTSTGMSYMPCKLGRTTAEAKSIAAECALSQLGYCSKV